MISPKCVTRGEGVQKSESFADVLNGWPPTATASHSGGLGSFGQAGSERLAEEESERSSERKRVGPFA